MKSNQNNQLNVDALETEETAQGLIIDGPLYSEDEGVDSLKDEVDSSDSDKLEDEIVLGTIIEVDAAGEESCRGTQKEREGKLSPIESKSLAQQLFA